jgi:hypothetical protein
VVFPVLMEPQVFLVLPVLMVSQVLMVPQVFLVLLVPLVTPDLV